LDGVSLDPFTLVTIALALFVLAYIVALSLGGRRKEQKVKKTYTLLKCVECDYTMEREFKEGDYVGKKEGACPKCGGEMIITAIYVKEESRSTNASGRITASN
jgi:rRNA maturation endonuclease Nob1